MKLFQVLKNISKILEDRECQWAICGGVAACLYRDVPRFTGDIDIVITDSQNISAEKIASDVLHELGFESVKGWITDQNGKLIKKPALIVGRANSGDAFAGIDFLLPVLPWIEQAVKRAQKNKLDYGFGELPTITAEDLIVAKLYSLQGTPERKFDKDDIQSIIKNGSKLDVLYIKERCATLNVKTISELSDLFPDE